MSQLSIPAVPIAVAPRATWLIVATARALGARRVMLPAFYCGEVQEALTRWGVRHCCYDVGSGLTADAAEVESVLTPDVDLVVSVHYFGLWRPPPPLPSRVQVLEDACHAARTIWGRAEKNCCRRLVVFSPRKEFGWQYGGILEGGPVSGLSYVTQTGLLARWLNIARIREVETGLAVTNWLYDRLGGRLPNPDGGVFTHLPLRTLAGNCDRVINSLRERGVPAWRWLRLPTSRKAMPHTQYLAETLILVPLSTSDLTSDPEHLDAILRKMKLADFEMSKK